MLETSNYFGVIKNVVDASNKETSEYAMKEKQRMFIVK